jgi:hypothetical protein
VIRLRTLLGATAADEGLTDIRYIDKDRKA